MMEYKRVVNLDLIRHEFSGTGFMKFFRINQCANGRFARKVSAAASTNNPKGISQNTC